MIRIVNIMIVARSRYLLTSYNAPRSAQVMMYMHLLHVHLHWWRCRAPRSSRCSIIFIF